MSDIENIKTMSEQSEKVQEQNDQCSEQNEQCQEKKKRGRPRKIRTEVKEPKQKGRPKKLTEDEAKERERIRKHIITLQTIKKNYIRKWSHILDEYYAYCIDDELIDILDILINQYNDVRERNNKNGDNFIYVKMLATKQDDTLTCTY